jgi:hypothetical protein
MTTYKLLDALSGHHLEVKVNHYLKLGWKLHGDTFVNNGSFYQAVIRAHRKTEKVN